MPAAFESRHVLRVDGGPAGLIISGDGNALAVRRAASRARGYRGGYRTSDWDRPDQSALAGFIFRRFSVPPQIAP